MSASNETRFMSLDFPNPIFNFSDANLGITFWGHDTALEITFFIDLSALQFMQGNKSTYEKVLCETFNQNINLIHATAKRKYKKQKGNYIRLTVDDF